MNLEISERAKAAGNGERLVIRNWRAARESKDFVALAHVQRYEWVLPRLTGLKCLDAGCGSGYGAYHLAANGASSVVGVDYSAAAIRFAKNGYRSDNLEYGIMDVRDLAAKDNSFDAVTSFDVMEHLSQKDQDGFVSEIARVLHRNGHAYVGCPNASMVLGVNPFHLRELTKEEFESLLARHFGNVQILGQDILYASKRQFGDLRILGEIRDLNIGNFVIVENRPDAAFGLLAVCENPVRDAL